MFKCVSDCFELQRKFLGEEKGNFTILFVYFYFLNEILVLEELFSNFNSCVECICVWLLITSPKMLFLSLKYQLPVQHHKNCILITPCVGSWNYHWWRKFSIIGEKHIPFKFSLTISLIYLYSINLKTHFINYVALLSFIAKLSQRECV